MMGMGTRGLRKFFRRRRRRRRRPPPQSMFFGENGILRFVTHSRAMNFLASAYESYGQGGSFIFSWIHEIALCHRNIQKWAFEKYGGHFLVNKKAPAGILPVAHNLKKITKYSYCI